MQRLGQVLHVGQSGNLIVKADYFPRIGGKVVNENLKSIGKVVDVFGPVSSPYASVKLIGRTRKELVGKILYVLPSEWRKREI